MIGILILAGMVTNFFTCWHSVEEEGLEKEWLEKEYGLYPCQLMRKCMNPLVEGNLSPHSYLTLHIGAVKLQMLDVSHNALGSAGVELLLQFLNPEKITSLVLSSAVSSSGDGEISKHVASYCSQVGYIYNCLYYTSHFL